MLDANAYMLKKELRAEVKKRNKSLLTAEVRQSASHKICNKIKTLLEFVEAKRIALYYALPDEPELTELLDEFANKKELYLPRVEGEDIAFYLYRSKEQSLAKGSFGIEEPTDKKEDAIDPASLELIVVPGMAFSRSGLRLGRGKAFYDRFLPKTKAFLVGVTFQFRLFDTIPCDPWDQPMDKIITD